MFGIEVLIVTTFPGRRMANVVSGPTLDREVQSWKVQLP
jgi:hypothetical protein